MKLDHVIRPSHWLRLPTSEREEGVTLIELLAVVVILAIIAAIAVPIVIGSITRSRQSVTQQNISILVESLNRYSTNNDGRYPLSTDHGGPGLNALTTGDKANAGQPYLQAVPNDGWNNPFLYFTPTSANSYLIETDQNKGSDLWWVNSTMGSAVTTPNPAY